MNQKGIRNRLLSILLMMSMVIGQVPGMSLTLPVNAEEPASISESNPEESDKTNASSEDEMKEDDDKQSQSEDIKEKPAAEGTGKQEPEPKVDENTQQGKATESVDNGIIETETPAEQDSKDGNEPEKNEETPTPSTPTETPEAVEYPAFESYQYVDGVKVTVTAEEGTFPEGTTLSVEKVEVKKVEEAVEEERREDVKVAASYTFDIKLLDKDGNVIQPAEGKIVNVSFKLAEVADQNLSTDVYHLSEEGNDYTAESLEVSEKGTEATVETTGFSYYTVEFTYNNLQYVLNGDESVSLSTILNTVGLTGEVTAATVSNPSLFTVSNKTGEWIVTALRAFDTDEWMKVTINDVVYEIVVTDDNVTEYPLWVNGVRVTSDNKDDVLENDLDNKGKVSFDPTTATLILSEAKIKISGDKSGGIHYTGDQPLNINLANGTENSIINCNYGIYCENANLTIAGSGTLNTNIYLCGIYSTHNLTIQSSRVATYASASDSYGIYANNVTIDGGTVIAFAKASNGIGIHTVTNTTGNVNINSGSVIVAGAAMAIDGKVINNIDGTGWTDTEGTEGKAAIDVKSDTGQDLSSYKKVMFPALVEYPLWVGNKQVTNENTSDILGNQTAYYDAASNTLTLNGATITTAYQPSGSNLKYGIYYNGAKALNIILAKGSENSVSNANYGIYSDNGYADLSITGEGKFTAANIAGSGIYSSKDLTISSNVTVSSTSSNDNGIFAKYNLKIESGEVNATYAGSASPTAAIYSNWGTVEITGGKVTATATVGNGTGIYAYNDVKITGGELVATATAAPGTGIWSQFGNVIITGGTVTATANAGGYYDKGILVTQESSKVVDISGGIVTISGSNKAIGGPVKNSITGTGWTNTAGDQGKADIEIESVARGLDFKKVQFPAAVEIPVACIINGETTTSYLTISEAVNNWTDGTTLKLLSDIKILKTEDRILVENNKNVTLDLNGYKLEKAFTESGTSDNATVHVVSGTLNIKDTSENKAGSICHSSGIHGSGVLVNSNGTLNLHSGKISDNINGGVSTLGTFNMDGGEIAGNTSDTDAGGVAVLSGTFNMTGGTISNNTFTATGDLHDGGSGGVKVLNDSTFTISGTASITGNSSSKNTNAGGVYVHDGATINVSGNPKVTGNKTAGDADSNVFLDSDEKIVVSGKLNEEAAIGITTKTPPTAGNPIEFTTGLDETKGSKSNFTSDKSDYKVKWNSDYKEVILSVLFHVEIVTGIEHGSVFIYSTESDYAAGDIVYLGVDPDVNYKLKKLVVKAGDDEIETFHYMGPYYDFTMPADNVTVSAEFAIPKTIGIDFGNSEDAGKAYAAWMNEQSPIKDVVEENGVIYESGQVVQLIIRPDVDYETLNYHAIWSLIGVEFSGYIYSVDTSDPGEMGPRYGILGKSVISGYQNKDAYVAEFNSISNLHMDDIFPSAESEATLYILWGTPIEQYDVECEPLICGTTVTYDNDTHKQSPEPGLTFDETIAKNKDAFWRGKDEQGQYSQYSFTADGEEEYFLTTQFESKFPYVFTDNTKVVLNDAVAGSDPYTYPYAICYGDSLILYGEIQADHDWEEVVLKEPTITEEGQKAFKCKYDAATQPGRAISRVTYSAVSGDGNVWTKGSKSTSNFRFVRSYQSDKYPETNCLNKVLVDGKPTDTANYDTDPGSVWVKLKPSYLETLSTGKHTIHATFTETYGTGTASYTTKEVTFAISPKSSGGGSTPAKKKDNVVTCQMAGFPANYAWNEAAKACQPGYLDAGGNFHSYSNAKRSTVPNTSDNGNLTFYTIAMFLMTFVAYITAKKLTEDSRA